MSTAGKIILFALKLSLALTLLYWLYFQGALDVGVLHTLSWDSEVVAIWLAAFALVAGSLLLLAMRLQLLLQVERIRVSYANALGLTMVGAFVGSVIPGLIAGDAVKALYLARGQSNRKTKVVAAVIVDRIVGMYSLLLLGTAASLIAWLGGLLSDQLLIVLAIAPLVTVGATIGFGLFVALGSNKRIRSYGLTSRFPHLVRGLAIAVTDYRNHRTTLLLAIGISVLCHALAILVFVAMATILRDQLAIVEHFVLDPLAMVLNAVPLTPGGLGITEGAFAFLFAHAGSPNGATVALLGRMAQYLVIGIGGALAFLFIRNQSPKSKPAPYVSAEDG